MKDSWAWMNKPEISDQMRVAIKKALRLAAKPLRKDAKNFAGSKLHRRDKPGRKTGRTTAQSIKVGVRQNKAGVFLELKGSGALNIWESPKGRKAYKIPSKAGSVVIMLAGRLLKISSRKPIRIPASGPRPVLRPALTRHETKIKNLVSREVTETIERLAPSYIEIYGSEFK